MKTTSIGIWMDHSTAHLIELTSAAMHSTIIESAFTSEDKKEVLQKGEKAMHHKQLHEQLAYYKEIGAVIRNYKRVLLFGPTEAKTELLNILKGDALFNDISIHARQADKMTEPQKYAFVKDYFFKELI
jgi:hypothetical protein